jgi:hypothetical protein
MSTVAIRIQPAQRGADVQEMAVRFEILNERQRETLRWLPTDRRGITPILRGPAKTTKVAAHLVEIQGGATVAADFDFPVPAQAIEEDIPGLLDLWRGELGKRCEQIGEREAWRARRSATNEGKGQREPRPRVMEGDAAPAEGEEVDEEGAVSAPEADAKAELRELHRCLPLLRAIEVEPMVRAAQPDARRLRLVGAGATRRLRWPRVCPARIDEAIAAVYGGRWRDADLVEDLYMRIGQAYADAKATHEE